MKKYIENIKYKYKSFVPALSNVTISDVKQHLNDMFPAAFPKNLPVPEIVQPPVTPVEEVNNNVEPFDAEPITSNCGNRSANRMISPLSRGYASLGTS